jgi:hypothetical protein
MRVVVSRTGLLFVLITSLIISTSQVSGQNGSQVELAVDTQDFNQDGLLVLYGGLRLGGDLGLPVGCGDLNGDGRADVMFCQMYGSSISRIQNGILNIYLSDGRDSGFVNGASNPASIVRINGAGSGDLLGTSVSANGDINGDGLRDIVVGSSAQDGPSNSRFNAGAAYVINGASEFNPSSELFNIDGSPSPGVTVIYGPQTNGRMGIWLDAGDLDGDGLADIVIGSDQLSADNEPHVGGAYIVFGSHNLPQVIDLAAPPSGVRVTRVLGAEREDHWGAALQVGDINDDQIGDLIIGGSIFRDSASYVDPGREDGQGGLSHDSAGANFQGRINCGAVMVLYGTSQWPAEIDLGAPPANATRVYGAREGDLLGSQVHFGDLNGDGRTELIVGALQAQAPDLRGNTGAVYIIYGSPSLPGATIDLASPESSGLTISSIYGEDPADCAGDSVRAYDINNDGMSELFIGSPEHTLLPEDLNGKMGRVDAGDTKFIFGRRAFLPPVVKLWDLPAGFRILRLAGGDGGDEFSYRLTGGDVDGDGFTDYISNAMHADGFNNGFFNTGDVYIFSGRKLSAHLDELPEDPAPTPVIVSATLNAGGQNVQQAEAGRSGMRVVISGTNLRADTEVVINLSPVVAHLQTSGPDAGRIIVDLDENLSIRNSVGQLRVRARNLDPAPSPFSAEAVAGRLVGPEITSINPKIKSNGQLQIKIKGANFPPGGTVEITTMAGASVRLKVTNFQDDNDIKVKIRSSDVPARGTSLRIRVVTQSGIASNEVTTSVP